MFAPSEALNGLEIQEFDRILIVTKQYQLKLLKACLFI